MLDLLVVFHVGKCTVRPMDTSWVREFLGNMCNQPQDLSTPKSRQSFCFVIGAFCFAWRWERWAWWRENMWEFFFKGWNKKIRWWVEQWVFQPFMAPLAMFPVSHWHETNERECSNHHSWVAMLVFSGVICFRRGVYKKPGTKSIQFDISPKHPYHLCMQ